MLYFDLTKISGVTRQICKHVSTYNEDGFSRSPDFHAPVWLSSVPWHCRTERAELSDGLQTRLDHFPHWTGAVGDSLMGHCLAHENWQDLNWPPSAAVVLPTIAGEQWESQRWRGTGRDTKSILSSLLLWKWVFPCVGISGQTITSVASKAEYELS